MNWLRWIQWTIWTFIGVIILQNWIIPLFDVNHTPLILNLESIIVGLLCSGSICLLFEISGIHERIERKEP